MTHIPPQQVRRVYDVIADQPDITTEELQAHFVMFSPAGLAHCTSLLVLRGSVLATRTLNAAYDVTLSYRAWKFKRC